jgi:hypothetical protein
MKLADFQSSGEKAQNDDGKFGNRIDDIRAKLNTIKTDLDTDSENSAKVKRSRT